MTTPLKKLTINSALCDLTGLSEERIAPYSSLQINASVIVLSPKAQALLARIPVDMNAASIIQAVEGMQMSVKNGKFEIVPGAPPRQPTMLMVNGRLIIRPGSQEALKGYHSIHVNGKVLYPKSLEGFMAGVQINGKAVPYPDEAILIDGKLQVDALFILRAKKAQYFVTDSVALTAENLNLNALIQKGARFITPKAYITESALTEALPLFDDEARIIPVPAGYAFVEGAESLDEGLLSQHGARLFIPGDLVIEEKQEGLLGQLKGLIVSGSVLLPERLKETFLALKPQYRQLNTYKGLLLRDRGTLSLTQAMLHQHPEGLTVADCGAMTLEEAISAREILDKLTLMDCGAVQGYAHQQSALEQVSKDVGAITLVSDPQEENREEDPLHEKINTAHFTF